MALLYMGGEMVQMHLDLPRAVTGLFQGMLLLFLLACDVLIGYRIVVEKPLPTAEVGDSLALEPQAIVVEGK